MKAFNYNFNSLLNIKLFFFLFFFLTVPHGMGYLSSLTRNQICGPCSGSVEF